MTEKEFLTTEFVYPIDTILAGINIKREEIDSELADRKDPFDAKQKKAVLKRLSPEVKDLLMMTPERYIYIYDTYINNGAWTFFGQYESYKPTNFVFELYFLDSNEVFYVGRDYKEDWVFNPLKCSEDVRFICDCKKYGVRVVAKDLSWFNSEVYADCLRTKYINDGLYIVSMQMQWTDNEARDIIRNGFKTYRERGISFIKKQGYLREFFPQLYYHDDQFDEVTEENLSIVTVLINPLEAEYRNLLIEKGVKILKSVGKTAKAVIVKETIDYTSFYFYHKEGKKVFNLDDVINFLNNK